MSSKRVDRVIDKAIETKLRTAVERAVRPLRATFARKRVLREELLAHLVSVFEEEEQRGVDPDEALSRTLVRFGEPRALAHELQTTIPRWNRGLSRLQFVPRPSDLTPLGMLRAMLIITAVFYSLALTIVYVLRLVHSPPRQPDVLLYGMSVMAVSSIVFFFPFQLVAERLGQLSLERKFTLSWRSAGLLLIAAATFPLWITSVYWSLTGEVVSGLRVLLPAYFAGPIVGPMLAVVQGRRFVQDNRYLLEWSELEVDG
jgi:hypothetical protein